MPVAHQPADPNERNTAAGHPVFLKGGSRASGNPSYLVVIEEMIIIATRSARFTVGVHRTDFLRQARAQESRGRIGCVRCLCIAETAKRSDDARARRSPGNVG
jgi:hypothetical protein